MSSWHIDQLKYAFGIGGFMSFYGVVGLIVWVGGDKMGLPVSSKIVVIALVLLTMPLALIIGYVATRRSKKKAAKALAEAEAKTAETSADGQPQNLVAPITDFGDLNKSAEEVVQFLKASNLGESGKDAVYSLPWYIVAGTPRAGKSSLVLGSNLNFQTLPSQRQSEQKFIRPTGNIDWRVTSDAVFVDTAGRYQTEGVDGDEWNALLETVKKYRPNRPLDGFLLVVNTERILKADERETEEYAKVMRTRLDEAMARLKVRFPVYLIFSNADSIEGFRDSFSTSKNEGKTLVWGATIPLEKSENAMQMFDGEYEILHNSLMKRRLMRLSAPFPPVRQLRIFNFPLHFGSARRKIGSFVSALFRPNPFAENPFLRGYYFTAAPVGKSAPGAQTVGNTYFTERLFRDVVLRDKDLVKTFIEQRQRAPIFGWALTIIGALLVTLFLSLVGVSLYKNKQILDQAKDKGESLLVISKANAGKNPLTKNEQESRTEINATEDVRELIAKLDDYERNGAPLSMRFGLYSGNEVYKEKLLPIYMSVIEQRFKKPTILRVEAELKKFTASAPVANPAQLTDIEEQNLGKNYDLLKAYLMLTGEFKDKAEAGHIANTLKDYWTAEAKLPPDLNLTAHQQLDFWAKQVDRNDKEYQFPRISPDGKLISDTRKKLQAFPAVYRYYKRKVTEISKQVDDTVGATTTEAILTRNGADSSFMEGNYAVPSAYTKEGFILMKTAISEANQKLSEDDWVMGEEGKNTVAQSTDSAKIEERYFRDYADNWRNFVKSVSVKPYKDKDIATNALQTFSSANSPMKILLNEVVRNTNLSAKPVAAGWWDWMKSFFQAAPAANTGGGTQVEKEFRPLVTFIGTKAQTDAPIEKYQSEIGKVSNRFSGISTDQLKSIAQELANDKDETLRLRNSETAITNLIKSFNETPSAQEIASLLQEPLGNLKGLLGADAKSQLSKAWTEQILPAAVEVNKGFPFEEGQNETDLTKLTAFLNPVDGKLSKFYDERLKKYFEESNGQLKLKDTSEVKFSDEFVVYLNNAFNLRKALFGTNPTPKFEYEFRLNAVKDALIEVTIDGTTIKSEGTASSKLSFPAGTSVETGVFMNFASTSGTSSTSGAPLPANTATAPAATTATAPPANTSKFQPSTSNSSADSSNDSKKFPGNWGLFRFVDAGSPQKQPSGEYLLSYTLGGKKVTAIVKPSGGDLFDKTIFRQLKAPQNFLK